MSEKITIEMKRGQKVDNPDEIAADKIGHTKPVPPSTDVEGQYYYEGSFWCWNCGATNYATLNTNFYMYYNCWYCGALNMV
ncbi:MAG: hypothetical protein AAFX39_03125 [Pseudomonadota bacterium]